MIKIFGFLAILLVNGAVIIFNWRESLALRKDAAETSGRLESYLEQRLIGGDDEDRQAILNAREIEDFLSNGTGNGVDPWMIVIFTILIMQALAQFAETELARSLKRGFVKAWTWRP